MSAAQRRLSQAAYRWLHDDAAQAASAPWAHAVHWLQWAPPARGGEPWLTLGLGVDVAARDWPRSVPAGRAGEPVPVRCRASTVDPSAQAWLRARNSANDFGNGTLGALLKLRGPAAPLLALTAGHVVAGSGSARALDAVQFSVGSRVLAEGRLHDWAPAFDASGLDTALDAGTVRIDAAVGAALQTQAALPLGWSDAATNEPLHLLTRDSRLAARAVGAVSTFMRVGDSDELKYRLVDGLCYQVDAGSRGGDSGAAIWDNHERLVAIHTGAAPDGAAGNAMATPIGRVLRWFGADLVTRVGAAAPQTPPPAPLKKLPPPGAAQAPAVEPPTAVDVLARTMWGEARSEDETGMAAVAHVVLNRRDARRWWGQSIEAVCMKPFQFSCWNEGDRNRGQLLDVRSGDALFAAALRIGAGLARMDVAERTRADTTSGATHYHASTLAPLPNWARGKVPCARIGRHLFYRGIA